MKFYSNEDLAYFNHPELCEAYSGVAAVSWYGSIERQLVNLEQEYRSAKNVGYADKIHTFLGTWRDHEVTGSINRETIDALEAATSQLAVDQWRLNNYFSNLRDQLRKLIASMEELPLDNMVQGLPRRRKAKPSPPNSFGAKETPPVGEPTQGEEGTEGEQEEEEEGAPGTPPPQGAAPQ